MPRSSKSFLHNIPQRPELQALLEKAKTAHVTEEDLRAQSASFIYGNAPEGSAITKESAEAAVSHPFILAKEKARRC